MLVELLETISGWPSWAYQLIHLVIAFVLVLPSAIERELNTSSAGLRTFPLVAVGSCAFLLISHYEFQTDDSLAKVFYGVITGIGFIGGGAILKNNNGTSGTATAASIWNAGAIGAAVALNYFTIALFLSIINFVILFCTKWFKTNNRAEQ